MASGLAEVPRYQWRARRYPWALRAIAAAEAVHGEPEPTCRCGGPLPEYRSRNPGGQCEACEPNKLVDPPGRPGHVHYDADGDPACHNGGRSALTCDPGLVTCQACSRTTACLEELAARMVTA